MRQLAFARNRIKTARLSMPSTGKTFLSKPVPRAVCQIRRFANATLTVTMVLAFLLIKMAAKCRFKCSLYSTQSQPLGNILARSVDAVFFKHGGMPPLTSKDLRLHAQPANEQFSTISDESYRPCVAGRLN